MRTLPSVALSALLASALPGTGCSFGLALQPERVFEAEGPQSPAEQNDEGAVSPAEEELPATEVDLAGKLYAVDPASMNVVEPAGLDALLDQVLTRDVLVYV